jgi:TonB family protein
MIPFINGAILAIGSSLAASIVVKATLATALALIGARLTRGSRAAVRHSLLTAAFGVLLVLPVASIVTPPVPIPVQVAAAVPVVTPPPLTVVKPALPKRSGLSPSALLLPVWAAGMALFLLPVVMGLWQVRSLRRSALPWRQGQSVVDALALDAGIHRRVEVLLHGALPGPMTCGILHPAILLSSDAPAWDVEDLNRAIVHELEHVRRCDWLSHCLARAVCAVYWFHPLVWIAWRQLVLEAERSCDDAVLRRSEATAYADQLVGIAQRLSATAKSPLLAMANRADLSARVGALLDSRQRRGRAGAVSVALACAAAAALVLTMSPLRMVAAPQAAGPSLPRLLASSALVMVDVKVSDRNGIAIEGLSAGDFVVTQDGAPQTISVYEFQKVADPSLSSYYVLGYYTGNSNVEGVFRKIAITLKNNPGAQLDYRSGYYTRSYRTDPFHDVPNGAGGNSVNLGVKPPVLIFKKEPEYADEARRAKYQGSVVFQLDVSTEGQVTNIRVLRSLGLGLDMKAIEAVKQWRFRPGTMNGAPVTVAVQVAVDFRLL